MLGHNLGCPVGTLPDNLLCGDPSQTGKGVFRVPARKELHMGRNNSMQKPSIVTRLKSDQAVAVGFISPALVVLSCVIAIPILRGIWTSFCDCSLRNLMSPTWAGLKNYIALFKKGEFFTYFFHTLVFVFFTVSIQLILGMGVALLLNSKIRGRAVFRGMMLIPWTIPSVVVALVWRWILQQQYGVINYLLMKVGIIDGMNLSWTMDATLAAFSNAERVTLVGSTIPALIMSPYTSFCWKRPVSMAATRSSGSGTLCCHPSVPFCSHLSGWRSRRIFSSLPSSTI